MPIATACTNAPYFPFEFEDADAPSGYSGFGIDLLQAVADELDLELAVENVSSSSAWQSPGRCRWTRR